MALRFIPCCSVAHLYPTFCDPMDYSTPGFPFLHVLLELAQTHFHLVGDAIQPSHPLSFLLLLTSVFSSIRVFFNKLTLCIRRVKVLVAQLCLTLCDPMDSSMPGLPVHHQLLEFTQTHVHRISDAIQSSHPLSPPFPPALNLSEDQGLF